MRQTISTQYLTDISQLSTQLNWNDFEIQAPNGKLITNNTFELIAIGHPNQQQEKWDMEILDNRYNTQEDLIYALVVDGKLLKIGKSINTMKARIGSYHSGKDSYRKKQNATNSATNWFILQSVITMNLPVYIYVMFIPRTDGEFEGWTFHNRISKEIEGRLITTFYKKYGFKPIGNKQN